MILATIVFTVADESYAAELSDEGWSVRGDADLTARLNSYWPLSTYGRATASPCGESRTTSPISCMVS